MGQGLNAATPEMREAVAAERALRRADPLRAAIAGLTRKSTTACRRLDKIGPFGHR